VSADEAIMEVAPLSAEQEVTAEAAVPGLGNVTFEGFQRRP
jgi:hypothetical protein